MSKEDFTIYLLSSLGKVAFSSLKLFCMKTGKSGELKQVYVTDTAPDTIALMLEVKLVCKNWQVN